MTSPDREAALASLRSAAADLISNDMSIFEFCETFRSVLSGLASGGPLDDPLDLDLFWAVEEWEPPGPSRVEAEAEIRALASRLVRGK